jgi:hypothetical protein
MNTEFDALADAEFDGLHTGLDVLARITAALDDAVGSRPCNAAAGHLPTPPPTNTCASASAASWRHILFHWRWT